MSLRCPSGHESGTADYCDVCGAPIAGANRGATTVLPVVEELDTSPAARREPCPVCGAPRSGDDRYCESCGHDFLAPPPAAVTWEAVVTADRAQFDRLAVEGVTFPADYVARRFPLAEGENRIGRSRGHPDEDRPEIDLATPPVDPGISRLHAVLERRGDGVCVVRDEPALIEPHTDVTLADGDSIRVGAWTTITVRRL
jgi:FHA domain-containing protein